MEDTKKKFDYYQNVTDNAISNLNEIQNGRAYSNTWSASIPVNGVTGMSYTPDSRILLMLKQQGKENEDPRFFTFQQIKDLGYTLKYGAKSTNVVAVKTRDENGQLLPFDKQEKHFENVFHASDVEQHVYKTDALGNKLSLLDRDGNPRFSKKDGSPLYQYEVKPIPPFDEPNKWHVNISPQQAENILTNVETNANKGLQQGSVLTFTDALSRMVLEAQTDIKFPETRAVTDIQHIIDLLKGDKTLFSEIVKHTGAITKEFKAELKKELAKHKEMDEDIPFAIPDTEIPKENTVGSEMTEVANEPVQSSNISNGKTETFMEAIGNNLAKICYESMKASGISEKEMLSVLDAIKDRSVQMVKSKDNTNNISTSRTR